MKFPPPKGRSRCKASHILWSCLARGRRNSPFVIAISFKALNMPWSISFNHARQQNTASSYMSRIDLTESHLRHQELDRKLQAVKRRIDNLSSRLERIEAQLAMISKHLGLQQDEEREPHPPNHLPATERPKLQQKKSPKLEAPQGSRKNTETNTTSLAVP